MPPPIVPAPMTATRSISRSGVSPATSAILRRRALGEEHVAQRARLGRLHQLEEELALVTQAVVERLRHRRGDRVDALAAAPGSSSTTAATVLRANWKKASAFG